jgi:hypothetical protein
VCGLSRTKKDRPGRVFRELGIDPLAIEFETREYPQFRRGT